MALQSTASLARHHFGAAVAAGECVRQQVGMLVLMQPPSPSQ